MPPPDSVGLDFRIITISGNVNTCNIINDTCERISVSMQSATLYEMNRTLLHVLLAYDCVVCL